MHDPLVVAWEIPSPIPRRKKYRESAFYIQGRRWGLVRSRRTNPENRGEPTYRWWRLCGWTLVLAGRAYGLRELFTVWHVEPGGHDSGEVCKHRHQKRDGTWTYHHRWKWHVHHWRIQWHFEQRLRRFLFERCELCGHRYPWGYAPVSHQWDSPKSRWFHVEKRAYHHECSALGSSRQDVERLTEVIRGLFDAYRVAQDLTEEQAVDRLCGHSSPWPFHVHYRLQGLLGWERDDNYKLVRTADVKARREAERDQRIAEHAAGASPGSPQQ